MPGFTEMSEEKTISLMMMTDYETFDNDFEFDEGFDEEAIQLVDQLNEKAGISNTLIPEISYNIFYAPSLNSSSSYHHTSAKASQDDAKKRERDEGEGHAASDLDDRSWTSSSLSANTNPSSAATPGASAMKEREESGGNLNGVTSAVAGMAVLPTVIVTATSVNKKSKSSSMKKKKTKLPAPKPPPPPISKQDPRRTFASLLLNTFNSCDVKRLNDVFNKYCAEDMVEIHRYDGVKNPYGRNLTCLNGRAASIQLWSALFKSAPDFFYNVLDYNAFYSPDWKCMVSSRFNWCGTRIADIRIARTTNERVLQKKLFESSKYVTDEEQLLKQLMEDKNAVIDDLAAASSSNNNEIEQLVDKSSSDSQNVSLFGNEEEEGGEKSTGPLVTTDEDRIYLDANPLPLKKQMECVGTLFLELNENRKIVKVEFVFTALSEKQLTLDPLQPPSPPPLPSLSTDSDEKKGDMVQEGK